MLDCKSGIAHNTAHSERIHRIVPWNGQDALAVSHHDVLALTQNAETSLLQRTYSLKVGNSWKLTH